MNKEELKKYLSGKYQGWNSFLNNVIFPIFGEEGFEDSYETELLNSQPERRQLADATGICSIKQIGKIYVGIEPLLIFDITVSDRVMMERNRVNIQKLIRMAMDKFSCAFMLFHYKDNARWDWRFTYCRKGGNNDDVTDSKRYTFLLGPGQSCRTAAENFMDLYNKRNDLEVKDVEQAFSVEALSKEFFDKYRDHYADIVCYITGKRYVKEKNKWVEKTMHEPCHEIFDQFAASYKDPEKTVRDYIKKLLGRLVFLQFLQKKGWMGVPADHEDWTGGDEHFLQNKFREFADKDNFIDGFLEPLFNDLNTDRHEKGDRACETVGCDIKVPFLNGGLFHLDEEDCSDIRLP